MKGLGEDDVNDIIQSLSLRGRDGVGYYIAQKESNGIWNKKIINPENINLILDVEYKWLIANSRAIPTTEYETDAGQDLKNQQPFMGERFVVVHNGIIANDKELIKKYKLNPESKVDTAILPELFEKLGIVPALKELKGSFAILCYDKIDDALYIAKNFMPLCWVQDKTIGGVVIASLKEMLPEKYREISEEISPYTCYQLNSDKSMKKYSLYPKERNKKVLVVCSGGIDSVVTAWVYKRLGYEVKLIHFKYGQAAQAAELLCIKKLAEILESEPIIYDARSTFDIFKNTSKLLHQKEANADDQMLDAESTLSYVPNRNAILVMIAAGVAEMLHYDIVVYGGQQMDSVYPDNNPTFVDTLNQTLKYSLDWGTNVKFTAPLIHLIKHEIVELGKKIKVPFEHTCSCYYPQVIGEEVLVCGKCGCCQFRVNAFKMVKEKSYVEDVDKFIEKYVKPFM
ncbi:hypothetical protein CMI37_39310 [Candidatus Pacearchaeota archaeon]|nr:hypothetical protein [Candidatus Pacearchaeota archaeon]